MITNDQGEFLVDTDFARGSGFQTAEILKGCFCCRFPDFMNSISETIREYEPDYILAEPVGSCTDLLATVVLPLMAYHKDKVSLAPLLILLDATRLVGEYTKMNLENPTEPKDVLVSHQIKEAMSLLVSKSDAVADKAALEAGIRRVKALNPGATAMEYSARTGVGIDTILEYILKVEAFYKKPIDIDYDVYAKAEADYGWYNGTWKVETETGFDAMDFGVKMLKSFAEDEFRTEVAHAKIFVVSETCSFKISFVMGVIQSDGICDLKHKPKSAVITLNVRARTTPGEISSRVKDYLDRIAIDGGMRISGFRCDALIPGRPVPTYRMKE